MKRKYLYIIVVLIIIILAIAGFLYWQKYNDSQRKISFDSCSNKCGYPSINLCKPEDSFASCAERCMSNCEKQNSVTAQDLKKWGLR